MSGVAKGSWDDWSDRVNPAVVKDVRQGLRTRIFWACFGVVLFACLCVSVRVWLAHRDRPGAATGAEALAAYLGFICLVQFFLLPLGLYLSLLRERKNDGFSLLTLTGLGARRLMHGKFTAHLLQGALYACAAVPFLLFSYYLNGVDALRLFATLAFGGAWCALMLGAAMFCGGMSHGPTPDKAVDALTLFLLLGALFVGGPIGYAVTFGLSDFVARHPASALFGIGTFSLLFCGLGMLALELSVDFVARLNERDARPGKYIPVALVLASSALLFVVWLVVRL